jgi:tRNA pseudouridine38-40 synthase
MRYALQLSFNGTNYHGWQKQLNAHTVQAELEKALTILLRLPVETSGCGRTDTGVHAAEFYVHFDSDVELTNELVYRLNKILPPDIAIQQLIPVSNFFHARFDADYREYFYYLHQQKNVFVHLTSWYQSTELDFDLMNQAAAMLMDYSDFKCFSKVNTQVFTFLCTLYKARWEQLQKGRWVFKIRANRFLRNMVRAVVGTLIEVGKGEMTIAQFKKVIEGGNRSEAGLSVPAHALFLQEVHYPPEVFELHRSSFKVTNEDE